jgi:eukaryotic-like serine/threonine-protein kinase
VAERLVGGRYRLEERLGVGGMSDVWAAEDTELGRRVAIKRLGLDADAARFEREAHAVAALGHPNICQLYDYGEEAGRPYMVLEYLGGGTLEDRLRQDQPYDDEGTRRIANELASALAHAHARGLVHRDLKPANVLFDEERRAKVADFGIARLSGAGTLTEAGTLLGTAAYISPEQASGLPATPASDVYSLGVILFRMLTGRLPFEAETAIDLAEMHVNRPPPSVLERRRRAPADLTAVADASLAKDPEARPQDGSEVLAMLGGATTMSAAPTMVLGSTERTAVIPAARRRPPPPRRAISVPLILAALAVLALAGAGIAILATRSSNGNSGQTPAASTHATTRHTTSAATSAPSTSAPTTHTTNQATTQPATTRRVTTTPPPPPPPTTSPPPPPTTTPPPTTVPSVTVPTTVPPPTT